MAADATLSAGRHFDFEFQARYRPLLAMLGVHPGSAEVRVSSTAVDARFGRASLRTPVGNIIAVCLTGPYHAVKAIGIRMSFSDRGLTFGTTPVGGVCLQFREPVSARGIPGGRKYTALTVTVADREGLAALVRAAAGLSD